VLLIAYILYHCRFEKQVLKLAASGPSKVSPFTIPAILGNTASGVIAIETGAKGPNFGLVSACATATHCIGEAMKTIKAGEVHLLLYIDCTVMTCHLCVYCVV
jgi:3-oxoacyl-[acyl-carrier-protein] synthase II